MISDMQAARHSSGKTAVVFLCGLLSDDTVWAMQRDALAADRDVLTCHFPDRASFVDMAADVLAAAPARFALAGHSMGARVALEVFRQAPERVERLALLNTGVHPRAAGEIEKRMVLVDVARQQGMEALAAAWLPPMISPGRRQDQALVDTLTAMVLRATPESYAGQIQALLDRPDATPLLATIRCPTLISTGDQDAWSPLAQHQAMAAAIPGSLLLEIRDAGHFAAMEQPQAVLDALQVWLQR